MLSDVNKLFVFKSLLTTSSNILPLHLKKTFLPIIWIFTEDGIWKKEYLSIFFFNLIFNFQVLERFQGWTLRIDDRMRLRRWSFSCSHFWFAKIDLCLSSLPKVRIFDIWIWWLSKEIICSKRKMILINALKGKEKQLLCSWIQKQGSEISLNYRGQKFSSL